MDPKPYIENECDWLANGKDVYPAASYNRRLKTASRRVSDGLGLDDDREFEKLMHWVLMDCGMVYNSRFRAGNEDCSTVDFRTFERGLLSEKLEKYRDYMDAHCNGRSKA